jgi:rsbT co-antagonist protein RsbR
MMTKETAMATRSAGKWTKVLARDKVILLRDWAREQKSATTERPDLMADSELKRESVEFLDLLLAAMDDGASADISAEPWATMREFLGSISRSRATKGFSPGETATFVLSLKQPAFALLQAKLKDDPALLEEVWAFNAILDKLGLYTTEVFQSSREEIIRRQQAEMLELSTPVVQLWEGILALPLIGTLDSARTQVVMENLLQGIVDTSSRVAVIDITGVPTVDTVVAKHLVKTVSAARLMGAHCIISGIRPQIAQTMVHLGVDFEDVETTASLADALARAFRLHNLQVSQLQPRS